MHDVSFACRLILTISLLAGHGLHAQSQAPQTVQLPITRDTWVSNYHSEVNGNNGRSGRLKLKGIQELSLIDLSTRPLGRRRIRHAEISLRSVSRDRLLRVSVSTVASPWTEGTGTSYTPKADGASFAMAQQGQRTWTRAGGDLSCVINGNGHTRWSTAPATPPDANQRQRIRFDPIILAAVRADLSCGLALTDDIGHEYERRGDRFTFKPFRNRFVASRHWRPGTAPLIHVQLGEMDTTPPRPVSQLSQVHDDLPPGQAKIQFSPPADNDLLGYRLYWIDPKQPDQRHRVPRYLVPFAEAHANTVTVHLYDLNWQPGKTYQLMVEPVDRTANPGPIAACRVTASSAKPLSLPTSTRHCTDPTAPTLNIGNVQLQIVDMLDKIDITTGRMIPAQPEGYGNDNHRYRSDPLQITVDGARNAHVGFQIVCKGAANQCTIRCQFQTPGQPTIRPNLYRFEYLKTKAGIVGDPLSPTTMPTKLPAARQPIPGQQYTCFLIDWHIPHRMQPGICQGQLIIDIDGRRQLIPIQLTVRRFMLPDRLSFVPEMNCYQLPPAPGSTAYYRLAHAHRTCLNRLPYGWRGRHVRVAPAWRNGQFDFTKWDRQVGPLLDGSAFADLPRAGVPVDVFYLPINEDWPIGFDEHFKGGYWPNDALSDHYRSQWIDAMHQLAKHLAEKQWQQTVFQCYLNNKIYHKQDQWQRSSAAWIFDEPVNLQDFAALRWYARAFAQATTEYRRIKLAFRGDISRPQWQRNTLDGLMQVNVVGGDFGKYHRMVDQRREQFNQKLIPYGGSNRLDKPNTQPVGWCIQSWLSNGDGVLPWQTVGNAGAWHKPDSLALFYPGQPVGQTGPVPSVRLKAYRQGQQLTEYLTIWQQLTGRPRWACRKAVTNILNLQNQIARQNDQDAGVVRFDRLTPAQLAKLQRTLGEHLDRFQIPDQRSRNNWHPTAPEANALKPLHDGQAN